VLDNCEHVIAPSAPEGSDHEHSEEGHEDMPGRRRWP